MNRIRTAIAAATLAATAATTFAVATSTSAQSKVHKTNSYWAVVAVEDNFPVLARGQGVMGVTKISHPEYALVQFERDVDECSFTATLGSEGTDLVDPGFATVRTSPGDPSVVRVATYHATGTPQPSPFHLHVMCRDTVTFKLPDYAPDSGRG